MNQNQLSSTHLLIPILLFGVQEVFYVPYIDTIFVYCKNVFFFVTGEVERLLREYTQNQEMVRNIGSTYYQIVYPVQLRQHKKMGISTREIGSSKVRKARSTVCHSTFSSHSPP